MTGTDPAVEAANRVHEANLGRLIGHDTVVAAAREALAPIRQILDDYDGDPINAIEALRVHLEGGPQ